MSSKLISVIVPIYNAEKYLSECIESILCQTYTSFELLLIDDGSTDGSLKICNEFKKKDNRVKVFHHENHGVSYTRNEGISASIGDYITFIDADDLILPQYLEKLLGVVGTSDFSSKVISFCRFFNLMDNNERLVRYEYYDNLRYGKHNLSLTIEDIFSGKLFGSICRMLISSDLIKSNSLIFSECKFREDQLFLFDLINYADAFAECDEFLYIYRNNPNSASRVRYINDLVDDQCRYLSTFQKKVNTYSLDDATKTMLFGYALLDVKILWLINAAKSCEYHKEIKAIKSTKYFTYPIGSDIENHWKSDRGKTSNIVLSLLKKNLFNLIYCFLKLKDIVFYLNKGKKT